MVRRAIPKVEDILNLVGYIAGEKDWAYVSSSQAVEEFLRTPDKQDASCKAVRILRAIAETLNSEQIAIPNKDWKNAIVANYHSRIADPNSKSKRREAAKALSDSLRPILRQKFEQEGIDPKYVDSLVDPLKI